MTSSFFKGFISGALVVAILTTGFSLYGQKSMQIDRGGVGENFLINRFGIGSLNYPTIEQILPILDEVMPIISDQIRAELNYKILDVSDPAILIRLTVDGNSEQLAESVELINGYIRAFNQMIIDSSDALCLHQKHRYPDDPCFHADKEEMSSRKFIAVRDMVEINGN